MRENSRGADRHQAAGIEEERGSAAASTIALAVWLLAGVAAFLPFAFDTSAWDAVILRVPGNQGNWWHFLAGAPFFLAYPMIWLRLRGLYAKRPSTPMGRRILWGVAGLSMAGTILVESPFLLHLAGTSAWQRFAVLGLGFGIMLGSAAILIVRRRHFPPTRACIVGLNTAYLANAALCLVVYSDATGGFLSRSGWFVTAVIVWPMLMELVWHLARSFRMQTPQARAVAI